MLPGPGALNAQASQLPLLPFSQLKGCLGEKEQWVRTSGRRKQNKNTGLSLHETLASAPSPHIHPILSILGLSDLIKPPPPAPATPGQALILTGVLLWVPTCLQSSLDITARGPASGR